MKPPIEISCEHVSGPVEGENEPKYVGKVRMTVTNLILEDRLLDSTGPLFKTIESFEQWNGFGWVPIPRTVFTTTIKPTTKRGN